jgi:hypothetical protein
LEEGSSPVAFTDYYQKSLEGCNSIFSFQLTKILLSGEGALGARKRLSPLKFGGQAGRKVGILEDTDGDKIGKKRKMVMVRFRVEKMGKGVTIKLLLQDRFDSRFVKLIAKWLGSCE